LGFGGGGAERIEPPAFGGRLPVAGADSLGAVGAAMVLAGSVAAGRDLPPDEASADAPLGFGGGGAAGTVLTGPPGPEDALPACACASADAFPRTVTVRWPMVR